MRMIKVSIKLKMDDFNHFDNSPEDPLLDPNYSPDMDRLTQLVRSLRIVHPKLDTFWLDFGTTETAFWEFRYPARAEDPEDGTTDGAGDEEVDRGVTELAVLDEGQTASFTFYYRNVENILDF